MQAPPHSSTQLSQYESDSEPTRDYTVPAELQPYDDDEVATLPLPGLYDEF